MPAATLPVISTGATPACAPVTGAIIGTSTGFCCSPVTGAVIGTEEAGKLAQVFKALGDPTRVRLLSLISATDGGEACICDLTGPVGLSQPTVSHHMKLLADAGLVTREQRGKWAYYRVVEDSLRAVSAALTPSARH